MTTGWLLLLVMVVVSSQSVDSQSTTDDETCSDGGLLSKMQRDIERLMYSQQHQDMGRILDNQRQLFQRLGKCH